MAIPQQQAFEPDMAYMPVPRCDSCRWWKPFADDLQPATVGGIVERLSAEGFDDLISTLGLPRLGDCTLFECQRKEQVHDHSKVTVTRTGSGEATIVTHADFGCVQWQARP